MPMKEEGKGRMRRKIKLLEKRGRKERDGRRQSWGQMTFATEGQSQVIDLRSRKLKPFFHFYFLCINCNETLDRKKKEGMKGSLDIVVHGEESICFPSLKRRKRQKKKGEEGK